MVMVFYHGRIQIKLSSRKKELRRGSKRDPLQNFQLCSPSGVMQMVCSSLQ